MTQLTKHGINRINERVGTKFKEKILIKKVKKEGFVVHNFCGDFYDYLLNKANKGASLKIYNNMIYVLSPNKKNFITVYPIPQKFQPIEQYLITGAMSQLIYFPKYFINKDIWIITISDIETLGILKNVNCINDKTVEVIIQKYDNNYLTIPIEDIKSIRVNNNYMNDELLEFFNDLK